MVALRIGYDPNFAPLTFTLDGRARGLIVDIIRGLLDGRDGAPEFAPVALSDHQAALESGRIEAIAFRGVTPRIAAKCTLSDDLMDTGAAWFAPSGRPFPGADGIKVGRVATPVKGPLYEPLRQAHPGLTLVQVQTYQESLAAVIEGRAEAAALNFHIGRYLARHDFPDRFIVPEQPDDPMTVALAVPLGDPANILPDFNRRLATANRTGEVADCTARWLDL